MCNCVLWVVCDAFLVRIRIRALCYKSKPHTAALLAFVVCAGVDRLTVVADLLIAASYFAIPLQLIFCKWPRAARK